MKPSIPLVMALVLGMSQFGSLHAAISELKTDEKCLMPSPQFRFTYLDSLVASTPKPSGLALARANLANLDPSQQQIYLWYAFRNKMFAHEMIPEGVLDRLLGENEDAVNSILWLLANPQDHNYGKVAWSKDNMDRLKNWQKDYSKREPSRWMAVALLTKEITFDELSKMDVGKDEINVDILLNEGVIHEDAGKTLDALNFYLKVDEYGYRGGLIGAALLLPRVGGMGCVARARYLVKLSGVIAPVVWWSESRGGN